MTTTPKPARTAGVLLHPTSLPSPYGIGDLGPTALEWIDVLAAAGQTWWQVLPLGPTGYGDSPYQSFSAFAGNVYLLSPELMLQDGLLHPSDIPTSEFPVHKVDFGAVIPFKRALLAKAWENFQKSPSPGLYDQFESFCKAEASWLDDYALFMALKDAYKWADWMTWDSELILREPAALRAARKQHAGTVGQHRFGQFLFARQWSAIKAHAASRGIKLLGDAPIFVSIDSADVWANPDLFLLDDDRQPTAVAGVPPDYFSPTGQLWGNPLYDWERMRETNYTWWVARLKRALQQVDLVRLDHFRGFEAYWEVPAGSPTAQTGKWVKAPGAELFRVLRRAFGGLPIVAEDLGLITPEVDALRNAFNLPGMRILQFAFSGPDNRYLPHHYDVHSVVYPGTHDNDTTIGWYHTLPEHERHFLHRYLPGAGQDIAWDLIRAAWSSVACCAITQLQDLLSLGGEARMNSPGRSEGNWSWRFAPGQVHAGIVDGLADLTALYSRQRAS